MGTVTISINGAGLNIQGTITETGDSSTAIGNGATTIALAAGKAATDWVKTDADTAACNLTAGHGYTTGKCDVFWTGGYRYDVDMTVSTNALALDGGTGTDFPESATTGVVICTPQQINMAIDGDVLKMLAFKSTTRANLYFEDSAGDAIGAIELTALVPYYYNSTSGATTPLTGDPVTTCWASNGTTTAGVLTGIIEQDSTP
jgi:hypothetical protein